MPAKCGAGRTRRTAWQRKHGPGIGKLHHGDLSSRGYSVTKSRTARRSALRRVVKAEGPLKAFRQLNAVAVYSKNSAPTKSRTFKADRNWVRKTYMKGGGLKEDALQVLLKNNLIKEITDEELDDFAFKSGKLTETIPGYVYAYTVDGYTFSRGRDGSRGFYLKAQKEGEEDTVTLATFAEY